MHSAIANIRSLNIFREPPTKQIKIGVEIIRSGFQFTLFYKSVQELIKLWKSGQILNYDQKINKNMAFYFKVQTGFDILDFCYAYWNNKSDLTALIHHALIIFLCSNYFHKNKLPEGIMILGAMSNQLSGLGFNAFKILTLTPHNRYSKKMFTTVSVLVLLAQVFYRIPVLFYICAYSIKYTKDTGKFNKFIFFILLQLYNEYDWIRWSTKLFGLKQSKLINNRTIFLAAIIFSYFSAKKFSKKLENYHQFEIIKPVSNYIEM
jgi:hypothetical protein